MVSGLPNTRNVMCAFRLLLQKHVTALPIKPVMHNTKPYGMVTESYRLIQFINKMARHASAGLK
jgi:hypothetical protein